MQRLILRNHTISELLNSNIQALLNFMPGRYAEHELFYESIISGMNVVMTLEDVVVLNHVRRVYRNVKRDSPEWQVVRQVPRAGFEAVVCLLLSLTRSVEITVEMAVEKYRGEAKEEAIVGVEAFKAALKLLLLLSNRGRMLERQGHPPRSQLNTLSMTGPKDEERVVEVTEPVAKAAPAQEWAAEVLHVARPLVHLWGGRYSWTGWTASLGCDLVSRLLNGSVARGSGAAERARRDAALAWYLLRPPMWRAIRSRLGIFAFVGRLPLVGYFFVLIRDMLDSLARFWFFSSAS